jgi:hypothetical protein
MMFRGHKQTTSAGRPLGGWLTCGVVSFGPNACPFSLSEYLQAKGGNRSSHNISAQQLDYRQLQ